MRRKPVRVPVEARVRVKAGVNSPAPPPVRVRLAKYGSMKNWMPTRGMTTAPIHAEAVERGPDQKVRAKGNQPFWFPSWAKNYPMFNFAHWRNNYLDQWRCSLIRVSGRVSHGSLG